MYKIINTLFLGVLLTGCTRITPRIIEEDFVDGKLTHRRITRLSATTFFDSNNKLANFKSGQDKNDKQTLSIGNLNQESSGSNSVLILQNVNGSLRTLAIPAP